MWLHGYNVPSLTVTFKTRTCVEKVRVKAADAVSPTTFSVLKIAYTAKWVMWSSGVGRVTRQQW